MVKFIIGDTMKLYEYLKHLSNDQIMDFLLFFDGILQELHSNGYFVKDNVGEIELINNQITQQSFINKIWYFYDELNKNFDLDDIKELFCVAISAYNHFDKNYSSSEFINYFRYRENLDLYIDNGKVPKVMRDYFRQVFSSDDLVYYLNDYMDTIKKDGSGRGNTSVKVKSTPYGKLYSNEDEAAYTSALILPSVIALVYLILLICYFIFFR